MKTEPVADSFNLERFVRAQAQMYAKLSAKFATGESKATGYGSSFLRSVDLGGA